MTKDEVKQAPVVVNFQQATIPPGGQLRSVRAAWGS